MRTDAAPVQRPRSDRRRPLQLAHDPMQRASKRLAIVPARQLLRAPDQKLRLRMHPHAGLQQNVSLPAKPRTVANYRERTESRQQNEARREQQRHTRRSNERGDTSEHGGDERRRRGVQRARNPEASARRLR